ncbi:MAG: phage minor head protein [Gallionellaceae bacterium]|nr:phage minor head protein [Gallionellaceae bacterium]
MEKIDLSHAFGLPPEKAIEYFQQKGYKLTWDWREMWQEAHAKAFTVAKVMNTDILNDIRGGLDDALNNGATFQEFKQKLTPLLQDKGWWGKTEHVDTTTGEVSTVQLGSPRRLKTIYQTNLQTAYMAGRYKSMMEISGSHPYWQYVAVLDGRTRPMHRAMNGRIFRYDDPLWGYSYPPNGFNCRCRVRARADLGGATLDNSDGKLIDHDIQMRDGSTVTVKALRLQVNGQDKLFAPDAGWSYNPGAAWQENMANTALIKMQTAIPAVAALAMREILAQTGMIGALAEDFRTWASSIEHSRGELRRIGMLLPEVVAGLEARNIRPASALITVRDEDVLHTHRDQKENRIPWEIYQELPRLLDAPRAVLLELDTKTGKPKQPAALLYVFDVPGDKTGKLVMQIDYEVDVREASGKKVKVPMNILQSGKIINPNALQDRKTYEVLYGGI